MSDIIGVNVTDCFGIGKLSETISRGIGKIYEPIHLRRMANAHAESIKTLNHSILDADLPTLYGDGTIMINGQDFTELAQRAQRRIAFQELKKQDNLDHIVAHAAKELEEIPTVDSKPVDEDWISHFFDAAAHVSSAEMQQLWGKILAGEITSGGSFSIRTLELVKRFTQDDAQLFTRIASLVFRTAHIYFLPCNEKLLLKYNVSYDDLLQLETCGLINLHPFQNINSNIEPHQSNRVYNGKHSITITNNSEEIFFIKYECYFLTQPAKELFSLIKTTNTHHYVEDVKEHIKTSIRMSERLLLQCHSPS